MVQTTQSEQQKKKKIFRNEESLRDNIKYTNICITEFPGDKREKGAEIIFEKIMAENFFSAGPESTKTPKQDESKEIYTKTYSNSNSKSLKYWVSQNVPSGSMRKPE